MICVKCLWIAFKYFNWNSELEFPQNEVVENLVTNSHPYEVDIIEIQLKANFP